MRSPGEPTLFTLRTLLVCPLCKGDLTFSSRLITCVSCRAEFLQTINNIFDFMPRDLLEKEDDNWQARQLAMESWYNNLVANPTKARYCFTHDYTPYAPILTKLSGLVLDIGGGNGIVRQFLSKDAEYIVIDPSLDWLDPKWITIADKFPCLKTPPNFVRGLGEYLPFAAQSFDHVLALWSLNHAREPEKVFQEVYRILRPGGHFLAVLEDMEPRWSELRFLLAQIEEKERRRALVRWKLWRTLRGGEWPLQDDHIGIRECDIKKWVSGRFTIQRRSWMSECLTYEFLRS
jgi:SAM-dependent methyltransferase